MDSLQGQQSPHLGYTFLQGKRVARAQHLLWFKPHTKNLTLLTSFPLQGITTVSQTQDAEAQGGTKS